jgi:hypothetical protein
MKTREWKFEVVESDEVMDEKQFARFEEPLIDLLIDAWFAKQRESNEPEGPVQTPAGVNPHVI